LNTHSACTAEEVPDGNENWAKERVKDALEDSYDGTVKLLKQVSTEFRDKVRRTTGIQDHTNVLCTALVEFFSEYETELQVNITKNPSSTQTLKRALNELASFLPETCYSGKRLDCSSGLDNHVIASQQNVRNVLQAVRTFLIQKASEGEEESDDESDNVSSANSAAAALPGSNIESAIGLDTDNPLSIVASPIAVETTSAGHSKFQINAPKPEKISGVKIALTQQSGHQILVSNTKAEPLLKRKRSKTESNLSML
jgi:hypothetical protein